MVFTLAGIKEIVDHLRGETAVIPGYIASGTDNTDPSEDDTALGDEKARIQVTVESYTDNQVTFSVVVNSAQANGNTLRELGLFDTSTAGTCFLRETYGAITKTSSVEVEYLVTLKLTNG